MERPEPKYHRYLPKHDEAGKRIVSPLCKLLNETNLEVMLGFLQSLGVKFTITTEVDAYRCRLYWWEIGDDGAESVVEYFSTGKDVKRAMVHAIADFLVGYQHDFHDLIDARFDFRESGNRHGSKNMRRGRLAEVEESVDHSRCEQVVAQVPGTENMVYLCTQLADHPGPCSNPESE